MKHSFLIAFLLFAHVLRAQWVEIPSGSTLHFHDIAFSDSLHGWIAADSGYIFTSTDGGTTWSGVYLDSANVKLTSVEFITPDTGWIMGEWGLPWKTEDGGASWHRDMSFNLEMCFGMESAAGPSSQYFLQKGCFGANGIFTRTDTGLFHSSLWSFPPAFEPLDYLRGIAAASADVAVALGDNNLGYRTTDRGATWNPLWTTKDTLKDFKDIVFADSLRGWAVTHDEFSPLYRTIDGGSTWSLDLTWESTFWYPQPHTVDIDPLGRRIVGASPTWAGEGLIIHQTGVWSPTSWDFIGVRNSVRSFEFPTPTVGFAVGDSGMILRTDSIALAVTGSPTPAAPALTIFPNPATDMVNAELPFAVSRSATVHVINASGITVQTFNIQNKNFSHDVSGLPSGLYIMRVTDEIQATSAKLIIR